MFRHIRFAVPAVRWYAILLPALPSFQHQFIGLVLIAIEAMGRHHTGADRYDRKAKMPTVPVYQQSDRAMKWLSRIRMSGFAVLRIRYGWRCPLPERFNSMFSQPVKLKTTRQYQFKNPGLLHTSSMRCTSGSNSPTAIFSSTVPVNRSTCCGTTATRWRRLSLSRYRYLSA